MYNSSLPIRASNGTEFSCPAGQPRDRREKKGKDNKNLKKKIFFDNFLLFFDIFFCQSDSAFVPGRPGTGRDSLFKIPSRPVPWQDFELVPLSLCPGTMKKLLSRCPEKLPCPVPLETLVSSKAVGDFVTQFVLEKLFDYSCSVELAGSYLGMSLASSGKFV